MRVLLGNRIYFCTVATLSGNLILLTIGKEVYTVDMVSTDNAQMCHNQLLKKGYFNFSFYEYSN